MMSPIAGCRAIPDCKAMPIQKTAAEYESNFLAWTAMVLGSVWRRNWDLRSRWRAHLTKLTQRYVQDCLAGLKRHVIVVFRPAPSRTGFAPENYPRRSQVRHGGTSRLLMSR